MFVVTILSNPLATSLDPSLVESIRNAWGGGTIQWLAPDEAAEFTIEERPANFADIWNTFQAMELDVVVQQAAARKRSILIADMDSTIINQECIDELAAEIGIGEQVADITSRAMNGEIDFHEAIDARVGLLAGHDASIIETVLKDRISLASGAMTLLATMKANGSYCALVSGGFVQFTGAIAGQLGFDEHRANTLCIEDSKLTGKVARPILGEAAKVDALNEIVKDRNASTADVMAVGDGANDLGMLNIAGAGVALHAKPAVAEKCDIRVNFGDLTALLFLQGYAKSEFVNID